MEHLTYLYLYGSVNEVYREVEVKGSSSPLNFMKKVCEQYFNTSNDEIINGFHDNDTALYERGFFYRGRSSKKKRAVSPSYFSQVQIRNVSLLDLLEKFDDFVSQPQYSEDDFDSIVMEGKLIEPSVTYINNTEQIHIQQKSLAAVVYGIIYHIRFNSESPVILVPASADYLSYTLSAVKEIYSYLPAGIRASAGFATCISPDLSNKNIALYFVPEGSCIYSKNDYIMLDRDTNQSEVLFKRGIPGKGKPLIDEILRTTDSTNRAALLKDIYHAVEEEFESTDDTPKWRNYESYYSAIEQLMASENPNDNFDKWYSIMKSLSELSESMQTKPQEYISKQMNPDFLSSQVKRREPIEPKTSIYDYRVALSKYSIMCFERRELQECLDNLAKEHVLLLLERCDSTTAIQELINALDTESNRIKIAYPSGDTYIVVKEECKSKLRKKAQEELDILVETCNEEIDEYCTSAAQFNFEEASRKRVRIDTLLSTMKSIAGIDTTVFESTRCSIDKLWDSSLVSLVERSASKLSAEAILSDDDYTDKMQKLNALLGDLSRPELCITNNCVVSEPVQRYLNQNEALHNENNQIAETICELKSNYFEGLSLICEYGYEPTTQSEVYKKRTESLCNELADYIHGYLEFEIPDAYSVKFQTLVKEDLDYITRDYSRKKLKIEPREHKSLGDLTDYLEQIIYLFNRHNISLPTVIVGTSSIEISLLPLRNMLRDISSCSINGYGYGEFKKVVNAIWSIVELLDFKQMECIAFWVVQNRGDDVAITDVLCNSIQNLISKNSSEKATMLCTAYLAAYASVENIGNWGTFHQNILDRMKHTGGADIKKLKNNSNQRLIKRKISVISNKYDIHFPFDVNSARSSPSPLSAVVDNIVHPVSFPAFALVFIVLVPLILGIILGNYNRQSNSTIKTVEQMTGLTTNIMERIRESDSDILDTIFKRNDPSENVSDLYTNKGIFSTYLKQQNSQIDYAITNIDVTNKAVTVNCTYVDSTEFYGNYRDEVNAFSASNSGRVSNGKKSRIASDVSKKMGANRFDSVTLIFNFTNEKGNYVILDYPVELCDVATAKLHSARALVVEKDDETENVIEGSEAESAETSEMPDTSVEEIPETPVETEQVKDNLKFEKINAPLGVVVKVTNGSNSPASNIECQVIFYDENGNDIAQNSGCIEALAPTETGYTYVPCNDKKYDSTDILLNCGEGDNTSMTSLVKVEAEARSEKEVAVKIINNSEESIEKLTAVLIYYDSNFAYQNHAAALQFGNKPRIRASSEGRESLKF